jgi:hypothetical protein
MLNAIAVIFLFILLALGLSWLYFPRYRMKRPPIGVFNLWDVGSMIVGILIIPYLYLLLPGWAVTLLLGLAAVSILIFTFEPIFPRPWMNWLIVLLLTGSEVVLYQLYGSHDPFFLLLNNLVQVLGVVGIVNLWVQSGMKARDTAILAAALVVYDTLFTSVLPLMTDLFTQIEALPFAPVIAWPVTAEAILLIGLGDLLMAAVFPLVMLKAYGRSAGVIALLVALLALVGVLLLPAGGLLGVTFPVMIVLGPLMVLQYVYWRRRSGRERTTREYLQMEG